jgi:hypothetical protein
MRKLLFVHEMNFQSGIEESVSWVIVIYVE